ncbi:MAG: hypothetical protein PUE12_03070 [Oscillospiraceae bacterium]|nr:hypothetical protein [Oscillospiraceae bacterium]
MKKVIKSITAFALATACICGGSFITANNDSVSGNSSSINEVHAASAYTYAYSEYYSRLCGVPMYYEYYQGRWTGIVVSEAAKYCR